jgi:hypothetical protein
MPHVRRRLDDACAAVAAVAAVYTHTVRPRCVVAAGEGEGGPLLDGDPGEDSAVRRVERIDQLLADAHALIAATTVVHKFVTEPPPPSS